MTNPTQRAGFTDRNIIGKQQRNDMNDWTTDEEPSDFLVDPYWCPCDECTKPAETT